MRSSGDAADTRLIEPGDLGMRSATIRALSFSPDGKWLAFAAMANDPTLRSRIFVASSNGGAARPVTPEGTLAFTATWSPDGKSVAVPVGPRNVPGLWIYSLDPSHAPRQVPLSART